MSVLASLIRNSHYLQRLLRYLVIILLRMFQNHQIAVLMVFFIKQIRVRLTEIARGKTNEKIYVYRVRVTTCIFLRIPCISYGHTLVELSYITYYTDEQIDLGTLLIYFIFTRETTQMTPPYSKRKFKVYIQKQKRPI